MSQLNDKVAMRHMDVYMEQEEKYTEAVMSDTERLQSKLQSEMGSRLSNDLSTPPLRWGPWYSSASFYLLKFSWCIKLSGMDIGDLYSLRQLV